MSGQPSQAEPALCLENDLWRYALRLYGAGGVNDACLRLQSQAGVDVNLLLFCCWLAEQRQGIAGAALETAIGLARSWQETVVVRLRMIRNQLKPQENDPAVAVVRKAVLAAELVAEQVEQARLFQLAATLGDSLDGEVGELAAVSLRCYFDHLGVSLEATIAADLQILLAAAFPEADEAAIVEALFRS